VGWLLWIEAMDGIFGSSNLAGFKELESAGFLGSEGLRLGMVSRRNWLRREVTRRLRYAGDHHHLIVAGSGGGKFVSSLGLLLFDFLSQKTGSCVVIDPKGEALHKVGKLAMRPFDLHREGVDFTVEWLDPWDLSGTGKTGSYNFLRRLTADSRNLADDARALADAIIIGGSQTETHWDDSAKIFLAGLLVYAAIHPAETRRDLRRVCDLLMLPWEGPDGAETLSGVLGRMANMEDPTTLANSVGWQYLGMPDKERESILSAARRDVVWIKSPPMWRVLGDDGNAIDLDRVARGRHMLFFVLPFERLRTHRAWLRLMVTVLADAFRRTPAAGTGFEHRRHVFVDEWPRLKQLEIFQDEVAVARGANVQYHFYCQSFGQVEENYKQGWEDFVANSLIQAFAVQDKRTSEYLSAMTGKLTLENPSSSRQRDSSWRWSRSYSSSYVGRPVLMPDEIRRMRDAQLVLARGLNPVWADVERLYLSERFNRGNAFTLADVAGTAGRPPKDGQERATFSWWESV
jgi:type IV secretory pathway TraG/TraD family ATPase VirD4